MWMTPWAGVPRVEEVEDRVCDAKGEKPQQRSRHETKNSYSCTCVVVVVGEWNVYHGMRLHDLYATTLYCRLRSKIQIGVGGQGR